MKTNKEIKKLIGTGLMDLKLTPLSIQYCIQCSKLVVAEDFVGYVFKLPLLDLKY